MANDYNEITNRLHSTREAADASVNHIVSGADEVYDDVAPYRTNGHIDCTAVTPVGTENPKELRWYEEVEYSEGGETTTEWIRSQDTTVDNQKTYGIPNGAKQSDINDQLYGMTADAEKIIVYTNTFEVVTPVSGDDPAGNGWYYNSAASGQTPVYILATEHSVTPDRTYYQRITKNISSDESNIVNQNDGIIPTAAAVGKALGANFEDNLTSTSIVKGLTANQGRVLNEKKADKNGWYEQLVAGASLSVIGDDTDDKAKFFYRETGDSENTGGTKHTIEKGTATIDTIYGNTVKWNQLVQNGDFSDGTTNGWIPRVANILSVNNGICSLTYKENTYNNQARTPVNIVEGHYYYVSVDIRRLPSNRFLIAASNAYGDTVNCMNTSLTGVNSLIWKATASRTDIMVYSGFAGVVDSEAFAFTNLKIIDLTAIGIDNLTTTDQVEAWLTQNVGYQDYYPYNAGSLISLKPKKLISTGFNLWDGSKSVTNHFLRDNGVEVENSSYDITSYIRVLPSKKYYFLYFMSNAASSPGLCWYDQFKNYITGTSGGGQIVNKEIESPANAAYVRISIVHSAESGSCINISSDKNGTYESYRHSEVDLSWIMDIPDPNDNTKKLFPYGLLSAGSVHDEVTKDRVIKRVGAVDLSTLSYNSPGTNLTRYANISDAKIGAKCLCDKYIAASGYGDISRMDDGTIGFNSGNTRVYIYDSKINDYTVADFKDALSDVILYYELATPIEVTFEEPNTHPMNYEVEPGGTEEFVKADAALGENEPTSTSLTATIIYPMDTLQTIRNLETSLATLKANYRTSIISLTGAVNDAIGGGITYTEDPEGSGDFDFTYTTPSNTQSVENESI